MFDLNDLEIVGFNRVPECGVWVSKYFTYYVIQYAEHGEVDFQMGVNQNTRLTGPVAWLAFPGAYFRFGRNDGGCWNHRFVSFRGPAAEFYAEKGLFPLATPVVAIQDAERFGTAFDRLLEHLSATPGVGWRTVHLLEELLLQLTEQSTITQYESVAHKSIRKIIFRLEADPEKNWDFKKLAKENGISYSHLRCLFNELAGVPPNRFVMMKRLEKAAGMLRNSNLELSAIAEVCGFYDIYHFSKMFKKSYASAPGKYRKNHLLH